MDTLSCPRSHTCLLSPFNAIILAAILLLTATTTFAQSPDGSLASPASGSWQQGFDFRNTAGFVTDPPGDTYVLPSTAYPTEGSGVTYGWVNTLSPQGRDRISSQDPRLAGINFVANGAPATFYVDLPSAGTYNVSLAMGDAGYEQCWVQCQIQFLDGSTVLGTLTKGLTNENYFYDAQGNNWSAAQWPANNLTQQFTLSGTRLIVVVGTSHSTGDFTPVAFLGVAQASPPSFSLSPAPASLVIEQRNQGVSTITSTISGGFNSGISLSASGVPSGTTVTFNPQTIPAPGSGTSSMTVTVGANTPAGTYPITITGNGGGLQQSTTVTLTVTPEPSFTLSASPASLTIQQGNQGTSTITSSISGGFNSSVSLSASGAPTGTTVSFNPQTIPAPGSGNSTMTITVGASTATGTYPITVTGNGGGVQQNTIVTLTVDAASWAIGFDFRATSNYVTDPPGDTYVLSSTTYPTTFDGTNYGWTNAYLVQSRNRNASLDPRLAGINFATNGAPASFDVQLPSPGTYNLSLAMGDAGYEQCWVQCQIQFLDGSTVLATITEGLTNLGYFYDAKGNNWAAAQWPSDNLSQQVTLTGSLLTMVVGTSHSTGDSTPVAFLGVARVSGAPSFSISANPASLTVQQGNQGTSTITSTISSGFNSSISLSAAGVPSGTTVSFNPNPIPAPGSGTSTMTITVGASTPAGTYPITVTGNGGGVQQNTTVTLTVTAAPPPNFTLSANPASLTVQQGNQGTSTITSTISNGFNSAITLSASGVPSGTTVSFNPNPIPAPGSGNSTMTITVGASTVTGTYPITITGNGGGIQQSTTVTLTVTAAPSFTLSANPASLTVQQGNQGTSTITSTISGGFNGAITLSAAGLPSGTTVSFNPNPIPAPGSGNSTMTITVGASTATGTYPITITGNGGGVQQSTTVTLTVTAAPPPNFTLSANPASVTVQQGNQGTSTITSTISNGFNSAITLSASGVPSGTTVSFNPNPIPAPGSGNSTMTITVGASTATGTYPITITGNGGGVQQSTTVTLTVTAAPSFTLSANPASLTVQQGNQGTSTITSTISGGFNGAITLSAAGLPSGTTVSFNPNPIPAPGSGNSTMTITVGASTATGTYPITITGNGGGVQQSTTVTLTVTAAPSFTLSANPASLTVQQGNQGTSTITSTISGGFNGAITLSAAGLPSGTTASFNPNPIPAPGSGSSAMTITVGASTPAGTYPVTVTGSGGGIQQNTTVTLTVVSSSAFAIGFDFRASSNYVTDPPGDTYVLNTTAYPTTYNGTNYGWTDTNKVQARDRSTQVDPRLAGINYVANGTPATFYVDLPASGTYNLSLAMGDEGYPECSVECQIQFLDGSTVVANVTGGPVNLGYFYDAQGRQWSAANWPSDNLTQEVAISGSRLTVVVGTSQSTGDLTPIAFLGISEVTLAPNFLMSASPKTLSVVQGNQGTATVTTNISGGFNSAISLSAAGAPAGTTVSFNPNPIPAPGAGSSTVTFSVGASTVPGTYPITVTGNGGGVQQTATITLTVTAAAQPSFILTVSPPALAVAQGSVGNTTAMTMPLNGFDSSIGLAASGMPAGVTVSFNPQTIPAPGGGTSTMTITVAANTALGTYPITVTGNGGGIQQNATLQLSVISSVWTQGFDFRGSQGFVSDPPGDTDVLLTTVFPTTGNLTTYGWSYTAVFAAADRNNMLDPRLAGINYVTNGTPGSFYVNLPTPGTYSLSLAMGDAGSQQCFTQCQIQFFDGNTLLATVSGGLTNQAYFYDMQGNNWSAAQWPTNNVPQQVTLAGTQLTMTLGLSQYNGDVTPIAFLGVTQVSTGPTFALQAPTTVSVGQGQYSTADVFTVLIGAFNSAINLSASGGPAGTTISFHPATIPAPGAGTSIMTITVPSGAALGSYPITVTAQGGGIIQHATVWLNVTVADPPAFTLTAPSAVSSASSGGQVTGTITTTAADGFNSAISLSAAGAPQGTTVSFNPSTIPAPGSGSSVMSGNVAAGTPYGSYAITVTASSAQGNQTATVTLTVSASGQVNLPAGTGWVALGPDSNFCNVSPGYTYYNPDVGEIDAFDFLSNCIGGEMVAYGGGAADTGNERYYLWTSGHGNYQGNEMYLLNLEGANGPSAVRITDPDWTVDNTDVPADCACKGTNNCGQGMWHNGVGYQVSNPYSESGYGGPLFESTPAPDGSAGQPSCGYGSRFTPNAREDYAGLVYNPPLNQLFTWGGAAAADPTGLMYSNWTLNLNHQPPQWTRLQNNSYAWFTAAAYDYTTGHSTSGDDLVFDENRTLYAYNPANDTYTVLDNTLPYIGYNANLDLDPIHHYLVMENGDIYGGYHLRLVNIDSCNGSNCHITNLDSTASCAGALGYWAGVTWDSKRDVMAIFPSSTNCSGAGCTPPFQTVYLLNPDPNNPVTITYQGQQQTIGPQQCFAASYGPTPPTSFGPGVYSRFKYYPNEDIYLYIPNPTNPWILRLEQ